MATYPERKMSHECLYSLYSWFAFVVLGLISSVLRQEIGWKERLQNDRFCVEWDVKL